jgi:4-amino-4-deoxy-L-arabinose transferase-like glycosyltransferase
MSSEQAARYFWLLAAAHVVVWTLARLLAEPNAPLDVVEMAYLGREWQLGYPNHPPLAAWVTEAAVVLGGGSIWVVYLASQLAMVTCLWAAWRLGRDLLSPGAALLGAAVLECCLYYHFTTSEVNNNVALYPFWALAILFFHRALTASATRDWIATGACVGIGLLAKYSMAILVVTMVAFMLAVPAARRHWRRPGPYLALGTALVVVAPHLYWAARQHFPAVQWALERTRDPDQRSRFINLLSFTRDQLLAVLPIVAVLLPLTGLRWRLRRLDPVERFSRAFLVAMGLGPFAVQALLALALDLKLRSMYGSQLWTFTGVLILFSLALRPETVRWRSTVIGCGLLAVGMVAAAIVYDQAWPYVNGQPMSVHFPGREVAARVHTVWQERFDQPLLVVGGEWMLAANAALYSRPRLQVYGGGPYARDPDPSPRDNPWTSDEALKRTGGILLWSADRQGPGITVHLCRRFPMLEVLDPVALRWETGAAIAPLRVGMGVIPPGSDEGASARRGSAPVWAGCPREDVSAGPPSAFHVPQPPQKPRGILSAPVNAR